MNLLLLVDDHSKLATSDAQGPGDRIRKAFVNMHRHEFRSRVNWEAAKRDERYDDESQNFEENPKLPQINS